MTTMMTRRITAALWSVAIALSLAACERQEGGKLDVELDSAGSRLNRGAKEVGRELDTAWTDVKTGLNETKMEGMLRQMKGMDSVEVTLTPEGDVTLSGSVASIDRRELAEKMMREMKDVRTVTNTITIGATTGPVNDSTISDTTGSGGAYKGPETKHPAKQ